MPKKKSTITSKTTSHAIASDLFLINQQVSTGAAPVIVAGGVNHLAVIDCSGSMSNDLPKLRDHIKRRLPKLLGERDTFSLIWFSGRGQAGVLLEAEPVATLKDLGDVNKAIDRWLRPVGMTGFVEPLELTEQLVTRLGKINKHPIALFFMTDGCDNQCDRTKILSVVERAAGGLASTTFVEYGYYADRALLSQMAARAGGQLIFAEGFDKYEPQFELAMERKTVASRRIEVPIAGDPIGGFVFTMRGTGENAELIAFEVVKGKATVPEDIAELHYLSPHALDFAGTSFINTGASLLDPRVDHQLIGAAYAAMSLFAVRMQPNVVYPILKALGDVFFIDSFASCFGKQQYSEFMQYAKVAAFDPGTRYLRGYDPNRVPPDDAFTVLDLLRVLQGDEDTRLLLDSPEFKYSRVSRGRADADEQLSGAEAEIIEGLRAKMAGERNAKKLKELQAELDAVLATKQDALVFTPTPAPTGYPIIDLVYNESRPNISLKVKKHGTVNIFGRLGEVLEMPEGADIKNIPSTITTHIWRNYTIVRDGLVNIDRLPVIVVTSVFDALVHAGVKMTILEVLGDLHTVVINVKPLPILNRKMVNASVSAEALGKLEYELTYSRCAQKVLKHVYAEKFPDAKILGSSLVELYGVAGVEWLKEQGITEGGFSPRMVQTESTDFYIGRELDVKLKGLSTIPPVKKVLETVAAKKALTGCAKMMGEELLRIETFLSANPKNVHEKWLKGRMEAAIAATRGYIWQSAMMKFGILVGQIWFKEFKTLDENQLPIKTSGGEILATFVLSEIEIKV